MTQPFAVEEVGAGQLAAQAGTAEMGKSCAVAGFGVGDGADTDLQDGTVLDIGRDVLRDRFVGGPDRGRRHLDRWARNPD
ncbi:hypothetical protein, partial [Nocardia carnea]|uniref:hypothetical protein n=1 Tax=Nocardia carnea TaxID=37328 RepID=UPI002456B299